MFHLPDEEMVLGGVVTLSHTAGPSTSTLSRKQIGQTSKMFPPAHPALSGPRLDPAARIFSSQVYSVPVFKDWFLKLHVCCAPQRPEEGIRPPGIRVTVVSR